MFFFFFPAVVQASNYNAVGEANWNHKIHVDFKTQTGFVGLPPEWAALLQQNQMTAKDFGDNEAEAVNEMVGLMQFFTEEVVGDKKEQMPIPESDDDIKLEDLVNKANPQGIYKVR